MRHTYLLVLVLAACPVDAATVAAPAPVRLAFQPSAASVDYTVWTTRTTHREGPATKLPPLVVESEAVVRQFQTVRPDGDLDVVVQRDAQASRANGKDVPADPARAGVATRFTMSTRGERRQAELLEDWSVGLQPVFPDAPILPGHVWTAVAKGTKQFPADVQVTHRFEQVVTAREREYAIIVSTAVAKDRLPGAAAGYSVKFLGMLAIDVVTGAVLRSRSTLTTAGKFAKPDADGCTIVRKRVERWAERR